MVWATATDILARKGHLPFGGRSKPDIASCRGDGLRRTFLPEKRYGDLFGGWESNKQPLD